MESTDTQMPKSKTVKPRTRKTSKAKNFRITQPRKPGVRKDGSVSKTTLIRPKQSLGTSHQETVTAPSTEPVANHGNIARPEYDPPRVLGMSMAEAAGVVGGNEPAPAPAPESKPSADLRSGRSVDQYIARERVRRDEPSNKAFNRNAAEAEVEGSSIGWVVAGILIVAGLSFLFLKVTGHI